MNVENLQLTLSLILHVHSYRLFIIFTPYHAIGIHFLVSSLKESTLETRLQLIISHTIHLLW